MIEQGFLFLLLLSGVRLEAPELEAPELTVSAFQDFLKSSELSFPRAEQKLRMGLYRSAALDVRLHNSLPDRTFDMGINQFSVMTKAEKRRYLGVSLNSTQYFSVPPQNLANQQAPPASPSSKDHVATGIIAPVKNQGSCGSCWAFAATAAIEGEYAAATWYLKTFSEQELLDCTYDDSYNGCNGGWPSKSFDYLKRTGHLALGSATGYSARCQACNHGSKPNGLNNVKVVDYTGVMQTDEFLQAAIAVAVPAVAITVENDFFGYSSGIYNGCPHVDNVHHAVTAVGYDQNSWKIKNSWGTGWGEQGYMRMSRSRPSICRIADFAAYPNVQLMDNLVFLRNTETGRYVASTSQLVDIRDAPHSGAYGNEFAIATDANYYLNAVWLLRDIGNDEFFIEHFHSGRYLHSDGGVVRNSRGHEGGWTGAPQLRLTDANYYNLAIWKKVDIGGGNYYIEHKYSGRYLFAAGSNIWGKDASGYYGNEKVVGADANYYGYAAWKIVPANPPRYI